MDILIKNMEMPRDDDIISACIHSDGSVSYVYVNEDRPSVTMATGLPEHKKAYWKNAMCSNCGAVRLVSASGNFYYVNYCHNCGAEIEEATE